MLEGLEVTILNKSELENQFTFGAEFYGKSFIRYVKKIKQSNYDTFNLKDLSNIITDGDHGAPNYQESGILYLLSESIKSGFIDKNIHRFITPKLHKELKRCALHPNDVVVTKTGIYFGKSAVIPEGFPEANTSAHVGKISVKTDLVNPYYLSTFLNSSFGYSQLRRRGIKATRPEIKLIEFDDIKICVPNLDFQNLIQKCIVYGNKLILDSQNTYKQAEVHLLETLGLKDFEPSKESVNIKSFNESFGSTGRLDAEYYQLKYEGYEDLILSQSHTFIRDEYIHIKTSSQKDKAGYNYIEIGDINIGDGSNTSNYVFTNDLPANAKTLVQKGDILISNVRPYRGAVSIINTDEPDLIVSGAFTVLRKNPKSIFNNEVLKVLLRSSVYKDWLLKFNVGTSYPVIKDEDVLNLPIPFVVSEKQEKIAELVEESFTLKKQSEQLLELAKTAVEKAIEENEEEATSYINKKLTELKITISNA